MTRDPEWKPRHVLEVRAESGEVYTSLIHSDVSVTRLALARAVEDWFDTVVVPNWLMGQLDSLPSLNVRIR